VSSNGWFESVAEAQRRARRRLPRSVYGAVLAGSEKGITCKSGWRKNVAPPSTIQCRHLGAPLTH
jgi:hypothetical protein